MNKWWSHDKSGLDKSECWMFARQKRILRINAVDENNGDAFVAMQSCLLIRL